MTTSDLTTRVRDIVAQVMEIEAGEILLETEIRADLGACDLAALDIVYRIEDAFPPAEFSDAEIADCRTVQDLVEHLAAKVGLVGVAA